MSARWPVVSGRLHFAHPANCAEDSTPKQHRDRCATHATYPYALVGVVFPITGQAVFLAAVQEVLIAAVAWWASAVSVVIVRALLIRRRPARTLQDGPEWWDLDQAYPTEDGASWQARARCFRSRAVKGPHERIGSAPHSRGQPDLLNRAPQPHRRCVTRHRSGGRDRHGR